MLDNRSFAHLAQVRDPFRAVVFVHGFGGHPAKSWTIFDRPFSGDDWWDHSDLFFFGYASTQEEIRLTSHHFGEFLKALLPARTTRVAELVGAEAPRDNYKELILVGHSQGGLVIRDAVLQILWEQTVPGTSAGKWRSDSALNLVAKAKVRLFAPALFGARLSGLRGMALQSLGLGTVAKMIFEGSPSYNELQHNSSVIADVKEQTTRRAQSHPEVQAFRARIAWAARDSVVIPGGQYDFDPSSQRIEGTDHRTVCKPTIETAPQVGLVKRPD